MLLGIPLEATSWLEPTFLVGAHVGSFVGVFVPTTIGTGLGFPVSSTAANEISVLFSTLPIALKDSYALLLGTDLVVWMAGCALFFVDFLLGSMRLLVLSWLWVSIEIYLISFPCSCCLS